MDEPIVAEPFNEILPTNKKEQIIDKCTNWMNIKIIVWTERIQTKKNPVYIL